MVYSTDRTPSVNAATRRTCAPALTAALHTDDVCLLPGRRLYCDMRLLVDGSAHAGIPGGIQLYLERLSAELGRLCDVTVLTSVPDRFGDQPCRTVTIPAWTQTPRGRFLWEMVWLPRLCASFDALFCVTPVVPPAAPIPTIAVVHDVTPLKMHGSYLSKTKALFWVSLQTLRFARAVVTVSRYTRKDLTRMRIVNPQRTFVAYPGVQNQPVAEPSSLGRQLGQFILYIGSHNPNKNLPRLVAAFAGLGISASVRLVIAGWDEEHRIAATRAAIARHSVTDRVVLLPGRLSGADISSLYLTCRCLVHPSLYEGFGSPLIEALAHGAPAVCSRVTSLPEVAGDAAVCFDPRSVS
ncbi:glycosyltransferase family 4 protein, partial [candidate division WOR-3 bacterium]|nr:glycosyltransferase family 4 protein [candidate division WOR-3 bacterium]